VQKGGQVEKMIMIFSKGLKKTGGVLLILERPRLEKPNIVRQKKENESYLWKGNGFGGSKKLMDATSVIQGALNESRTLEGGGEKIGIKENQVEEGSSQEINGGSVQGRLARQ